MRKTSNSPKNLIKNILLLISSIALCLFFGELIVKILHKDKPLRYPRFVTEAAYGDFKIRRQVPNATYYHKSINGTWEFRINSRGFRNDKEFEYSKHDGTIRILTLGDSFTLGFEVRQAQTYSAVLEKYLKKKGLNVEIINSGVGGFSNAEELVFFENEGIKFDPDIVILGFYENDLNDNVRADIFHLVDGALKTNKKVYLPGVKVRDFLNSFYPYTWLSQNSYLMNFIRINLSSYLKSRLLAKHKRQLNKLHLLQIYDEEHYKKELAVAIIKRIYSVAKQNNIYFIILDIPPMEFPLVNAKPSFPILHDAEYSELCDIYFNSLDVLNDYRGLIELYYPNGMRHATEFTHALIGKHIGDILLDKFPFSGDLSDRPEQSELKAEVVERD